jgi:hypothetical protein
MPTAAEYEATFRDILRAHYDPATREYRAALNQVRLESGGFRPDVIECRVQGAAGEYGPWQIIPAYHPQADPCDLAKAADYRCRAVDRIQQETGNLRAAIASWNCGEPTVKGALARLGDAWETGIPSITRDYLRIAMEGALLNVALPRSPAGSLVPGIILPFQGAVVTQEFGWSPYANQGGYGGRPHTGIDVGGAPAGSLLCAPLAGVIDWCGDNGNYGLTTVIDIGGGAYLALCHMNGFAAYPGNRVRAGDVVGYLGHTGRVDPPGPAGTHTHIEVRNAAGDAIDPAPFLQGVAPPPPPPPPPPPDPTDYRAKYRDALVRWRGSEQEDGTVAAVRIAALDAEIAALG